MPVKGTLYSLRERLPTLISQGVDVVVEAQTYRAGQVVSPTGTGTLTVYDGVGAIVVDGEPAAVDGGSGWATATIATVATAASTLSEGWRLVWSLPMPDGIVHTFTAGGALVVRRLYPSITEADIYARAPALDPSSQGPLTGQTDFSAVIDEVDAEIQRRLIERGRRPWLIADPSSLRQAELALALAITFEGQSSYVAGEPMYTEIAKGYRREFKAAYARLVLPYLLDESGVPDPVSGSGSVWLQ